jgi:hypothetical protein
VDWQHIFAVWSLWWWLLTLVFLAGSFTLVACKRGAYFLVSLLVYLGLLQFLGSVPILESFQLHYLTIAEVIGGFLVVAIVWFNWRWHWFTSKMRGRYDDLLGKWLHEKGLRALPPADDDSEQADAQRIAWQDYFDRHNWDEFGPIEFRPMFRHHKDAILTWMAAWPLDVLVWLLADVLRDFWNMVYYQFQGFLQAIMERNWRGTEGHMLTAEQRLAYEQGRREKAVAGGSD